MCALCYVCNSLSISISTYDINKGAEYKTKQLTALCLSRVFTIYAYAIRTHVCNLNLATVLNSKVLGGNHLILSFKNVLSSKFHYSK